LIEQRRYKNTILAKFLSFLRGLGYSMILEVEGTEYDKIHQQILYDRINRYEITIFRTIFMNIKVSVDLSTPLI